MLKFEAFIVPRITPQLLTEDELSWLAATSTCKHCATASKRKVCASHTFADAVDENKWNDAACKVRKGQLLVVVASLSTGKKVIAMTYKGFEEGKVVNDSLAQLYRPQAFLLTEEKANLHMDADNIKFGELHPVQEHG